MFGYKWVFPVSWFFAGIYFETIYGAPLVGLFKKLGADVFWIGVLGALPAVAGFLTPVGVVLFSKKSEKSVFLSFGILSRLLWFLIPVGAFLGVLSLPMALSVVLLSYIFSIPAGPAWFSWISRMLKGIQPVGKLNSVGMVSATLFSLMAGIYLDKTGTLKAFGIVFLFVAFAGFMDVFVYSFVPSVEVRGEVLSVKEIFFIALSSKAFIFTAIMLLSHLSDAFFYPFLDLFLLRDVKLGYFSIAFWRVLLTGLFYTLFSPFAGKIGDRLGLKSILFLTITLKIFMPLSWLLAFLGAAGAAIAAAFTGVVHAFMDITWFSYNLYLFGGKRSAAFFASYSMFTSFPLLLGAPLAGRVARVFDSAGFTLMGSSIPVLFLIASFLYMLAFLVCLFLNFFKTRE